MSILIGENIYFWTDLYHDIKKLIIFRYQNLLYDYKIEIILYYPIFSSDIHEYPSKNNEITLNI